MSTTNLKAQLETRIATLDGSENRSDLIKLQVAGSKMGLDVTNVETYMGLQDATIDDTTNDTELVKASVVLAEQDATDKILDALGVAKMNKPYEWWFPSNHVEQLEMEKNAGRNCFGHSGSTWWVGIPFMRIENGNYVLYKGVTYESTEDRQDLTLPNNKQKGEAITAVVRIEFEPYDNNGTTNFYMRYSTFGINDKAVSWYTDEHHQPAVGENTQNGQIVTSIGSRNSAVGNARPGVPNTNSLHIRYGKDLETLSASDVAASPNTANYSQIVATGNSVLIFFRNDVNQWRYMAGPNGQKFGGQPVPDKYVFKGETREDCRTARDAYFVENPTELVNNLRCVLEAETETDISQLYDLAGGIWVESGIDDSSAFLSTDAERQYYCFLAWMDTNRAAVDAAIERPRLTVFGQGHPTKSADRQLRCTVGTFYIAGSTTGGRSGGGIYFDNPTSGDPIQGSGKLGDIEITPEEMELAYEVPAGKSYRLVDAQYGRWPRALICEFDLTWVHGATVPYGTNYTYKVVQYHPFKKQWEVSTIKTVKGVLAYKPWAAGLDENADPIDPAVRGQEGYTSLYVHGASFYRGENYLDNPPVIYIAHREGQTLHDHRLTEIVMSDDYSTVVSETDLIKGSSEVIYRPTMAIGTDLRMLTYDAASGYSSFNSFVSKGFVLRRGYQAKAAPTFEYHPADTTGAVGETITVGVAVVSLGGSVPTYIWEYSSDGGSTWLVASATSATFAVTLSAGTNGRQYRCTATNEVDSTTSNPMTVTVA